MEETTRDTGKGARRPVRPSVRVAQAVLGVVVGLLIAELAFAQRDGWAFQYLNIYRADGRFGVLLRPHATTKVRFGGAPATTVRTNALGFRGPEWDPPAANEVLVVGDSQAFGLGVEETESFASQLGGLLGEGTHVSNAAVPTFGPVEMERMLEDQLPVRKPKLVIYVVNAYTAFFEADRPNTERHGELDGWAVRKESLPGEPPAAFPGRAWLFGRSHLVLAARRWLPAKAQPSALGVPSEGTWKDLLGGAAELQKSQAQAGAVRRESLRLGELEVLQAEQVYVDAQRETEDVARAVLPSDHTGVSLGFQYVSLADSRALPGDIVDYGGEDSRPAPVTAQMVRLATQMRQRALADLKDLSAKAARDPATKADLEKDFFRYRTDKSVGITGVIDTALAQEQARAGEVARLRSRPVLLVRAMSPMTRRVARAKALCDEAGARLVVAVLPLDVQVSPSQWAKYGQPAVDMEPSRALLTDVVAVADQSGALGIDLTDALRAAGDGAFLPRDLHLAPKGHAAVAQAIAARVKDGAKGAPHLPVGGLPPGRSRAPTFTEWSSVGETLVFGSSARVCNTKRIREWVGVWCTEGGGGRTAFANMAAHAVRVVQGGRGETVISRWKGPLMYEELEVPGRERTEVMLVAPVLPEDDLLADFYWPNGKKSRLEVRFPANLEEQTVKFEDFVDEPSQPLDPGPLGDELCKCQQQLTGKHGCLGLPAQPSADCKRTYGSDCERLLGCASGDARFPPSCPAGQANAGALERCTPLCGPGRTCAAGQRCVDWQRGEVCLPEASLPAAAAAGPPPETEMLDADTGVPPETVALARAVVDAGRRATASCKLVNTDARNTYYDVYDECPLEASSSADIQKAVAALEARTSEHPGERTGGLVLFQRAARFFADRTARTSHGKAARGTLAAFAGLVEAWTAFQPAEKVEPYTEAVLAQYHTGWRTKVKAGRFPLPEWEACKTGLCL